jgi:Tol biopolymer transport system component
MVAFSGQAKRGDADIYVARAGAAPRRITHGGDFDFGPAWSPDSARLAFVRDSTGGDGGLYVVNADSSGLERLANPSNEDAGSDDFNGVAWSPDGEKIAFVHAGLFDGKGALYIVDDDGTRLRRLTELAGEAFESAWLPNSSAVLLAAEGGLWVVSTDASRKRRRLFGETYDLSLSPDGSRIAVPGGSHEIVVIDVRDGRWRVVVHRNDASSPTWCPDGKRIIFAGLPDDVPAQAANGVGLLGYEELYRLDLDTKGLRRLTRNRVLDNWPACTGSGRIVFRRENAIYVMDANGNGAHPWSESSKP